MSTDKEALTGEGRIELRRPVAAITRNLPALIALSVSFALMAYVFSHHMTKTYSATASIASQSLGANDNVDIDTASRQLSVATGQATSPGVIDATATKTGARHADIEDALTAKLDPGTGVIGVTASAGSPARSAEIANVAAEEFLAQRASGIRAGLAATETSLRSEIATLAADDATAPEDVQVLRDRLADLRVQATLAGDDLRVLRAATAPTEPSSPKPMLSAFLALLAAAIVGAFFVVWRDAVRKPVTSNQELGELVGAPVIALMRGTRRPRRGAANSGDATLRLSFEAWSPPGGRLVVVSAPGSPANATAVVERLGRSFAEAGHDAIVIDADFDAPSLDARFRMPPGPGLTRVLARAAKGAVTGTALRRSARPVPESADLPGRLSVLATGEAPDGRERVLTVKALTNVVEAARGTTADYVLVKVPSIEDAPHALILAREADVLVLAMERRDVDAEEAVELGRLASSLDTQVGIIVLDRHAGGVRREPLPELPDPTDVSQPSARATTPG
jgi:capsular polysaccharide biosynthesis protein